MASKQDKQVKILVVVCIGGLAAWYFTKATAMDVNAAKEVNAKAAEQMHAMGGPAPANNGLPVAPPVAGVPPATAKITTTVSNPVPAFTNSNPNATAAPVSPPVAQPQAVTQTVSQPVPQTRDVASLPPVQQQAKSAECNLEELKQNRNSHDDISDEEWACALTKAHDLVHIVERGETMSEISEYEFGTEEYWPKIWALNPQIENPYELRAGQKIHLTKN